MTYVFKTPANIIHIQNIKSVLKIKIYLKFLYVQQNSKILLSLKFIEHLIIDKNINYF